MHPAGPVSVVVVNDQGMSSLEGRFSFVCPTIPDNTMVWNTIVEPDGALNDGCFVLAQLGDDDWTFRQLVRHDEVWRLRALNATYAEQELADLACVRGVVIQKSVPGRRRLTKNYL